jgi:hypothetical protein
MRTARSRRLQRDAFVTKRIRPLLLRAQATRISRGVAAAVASSPEPPALATYELEAAASMPAPMTRATHFGRLPMS